jgi:hypothetical protein
MRLHRRFFDRVIGPEAMLEVRTRPQVTQLRLHHCPQVAGRMMAEIHDPARLSFEDDHHAASDLCSWNSHMRSTQTNVKEP